MTATFGKLHTQTLDLNPGLNVLEMPNETGKSTWCAFLLAMLYGVDTAERESRSNFPAKKHYAPWSGSAMEGRIRLEHNGRRITIERSSTARAPLGVFRAYDTESGLPIEELTAQNCGQFLLGVPRQVFERSAFLRQDGMSIQMEATLEQRLGALVTTGDETISYQEAERLLRERRNRCRYNKTGLIPQAEAALSAVNEKISRLDELHESMARARLEERQLRAQLGTLRQQHAALLARQAQERRAQLEQARAEADEKADNAEALRKSCAGLPPVDRLRAWETELHRLREEQQELAQAMTALPPDPPEPALPSAMRGLTDAEMKAKAAVDASHMRLLQARKKPSLVLWACLAAPLLIAAGAFRLSGHPTAALVFAVFAVMVFLSGALLCSVRRERWLDAQEELSLLYLAYGVKTPDAVENCCALCREANENWSRDKLEHRRELEELRERRSRLDLQVQAILDVVNTALMTRLPLGQAHDRVCAAIRRHEEADAAQCSAQEADRSYAALCKAIGTIPVPAAQTCPIPEGATLAGVQAEIFAMESRLQSLRSTLDRGAGQCLTLGDPTELEAKRQALLTRLDTLNLEYEALSTALTAIGKANETLQNRFSPRLTALAAGFLDRLTDGTYSRLMLDRNLSASLYPAEAPASREAAYFSGGTRDQLYLAVRLAVSELLSPGTPLILDDALVRFDDARLTKAIEVLKSEAKKRQVLLFTCQSRENAALAELENE